MRAPAIIWSLLGMLAIPLLSDTCLAASSPLVSNLKCEYKTNPIGIDVLQPRLSWKITSSRRAVTQSAYQIRAAEHVDDLHASKNLLWDSAKVESEQSVHVVYAGRTPSSRQRIWWQICIWDNQGRRSEWSEPAFWEMGLLKPHEFDRR